MSDREMQDWALQSYLMDSEPIVKLSIADFKHLALQNQIEFWPPDARPDKRLPYFKGARVLIPGASQQRHHNHA